MADSETTVERRDDGFELQGRFYPWRITDHAKDLQLIDRLTAMPVDQFFELIDDDEQATRPAVMLAMIACSIRAGNPEWSVERVLRVVNSIESLSDEVTMLGGDEEEQKLPPPQSELDQRRSSSSSVGESSSSPIPEGGSDSPTLSAIQS